MGASSSSLVVVERQILEKRKQKGLKKSHSHFKVWRKPFCAFLKADTWDTEIEKKDGEETLFQFHSCIMMIPQNIHERTNLGFWLKPRFGGYQATTSRIEREIRRRSFLIIFSNRIITVWRLHNKRGAREEEIGWSTELVLQLFSGGEKLHRSPRQTC